jgi:hypothetical protein
LFCQKKIEDTLHKKLQDASIRRYYPCLELVGGLWVCTKPIGSPPGEGLFVIPTVTFDHGGDGFEQTTIDIGRTFVDDNVRTGFLFPRPKSGK